MTLPTQNFTIRKRIRPKAIYVMGFPSSTPFPATISPCKQFPASCVKVAMASASAFASSSCPSPCLSDCSHTESHVSPPSLCFHNLGLYSPWYNIFTLFAPPISEYRLPTARLELAWQLTASKLQTCCVCLFHHVGSSLVGSKPSKHHSPPNHLPYIYHYLRQLSIGKTILVPIDLTDKTVSLYHCSTVTEDKHACMS